MFPSFLVKVEPGLISQSAYFFSLFVLLFCSHLKKIFLIFSMLFATFFSYKAFAYSGNFGTSYIHRDYIVNNRRDFRNTYSAIPANNYALPLFFNYSMNYNYPLAFPSYGGNCLYCNQWPSFGNSPNNSPIISPIIRTIR